MKNIKMTGGSKMVFDDRKLKRIRYESSGGSMCCHSEFEIRADAGEVTRTAYWSDNTYSIAEDNADTQLLERIDSTYCTSGGDEMTVREHIPMDTALWGALCEELEYLKVQLKPVEKLKKMITPELDMFVLDGGDYQRLYLTWDINGTEQTVQYYAPSGNRWSAVLEIIHEMVRPIGRDLRRIGQTQITEFFLKTPKYSYQITPVKNSDDYYFFVHGDKSEKDRVTPEQWLVVRDFLNGLDVSGFKTGKYEDKLYLRLNYNDGINKYLEISKKLAEQIREFIRRNIM